MAVGKLEIMARKIGLPFNIIGLLLVSISAWATYQNLGSFSYQVWLPVLVLCVTTPLSYIGWKNRNQKYK